MNKVFVAQKLCKTFQEQSGADLPILRDLDARFDKGTSTSIMGKSGSGKSTLLHILGGLDHPSSGNVTFKGVDIFGLNPQKLAYWRNRAIGFVFQAHHLLPDFSALENVILPGIIAGKSKAENLKRGLELLDLVELRPRADHRPSHLSGGEQQRVAIARALFNAPEVILADEPTGNLDVATGEKVGQLLNQACKNQGATLIMVTHNPELARSMDVCYRLEQGKLVLADLKGQSS